MKLYRFMSTAECDKLLKGEKLVNSTDHSKKRGTASSAKGFCFGIGDEQQARKALRRLRGIVSTDILMVFEPKDIGKFTSCQGRYIDYDKIDAEGKTIDDYPITSSPTRYFDEYCISSYSRDDINIEVLEKDILPTFIVDFQ
mgnify:FL=1